MKGNAHHAEFSSIENNDIGDMESHFPASFFIYPLNVTVNGTIREMTIKPLICRRAVRSSFVDIYTALTKILNITAEKTKIIS